MLVRIVLSMMLVFTFACNKKEGVKDQSDTLTVKGPILYSYKHIDDLEQVAKVGDVPVSWSQLMSQDPALQELQKKYDDSILVFAYAWAKTQLAEGQESLTLQLNGKEATEVEKILAAADVEVNPAIEIEYKSFANPLIIAKVGTENLSWNDYIGGNIAHSKLYRSLFNQRIQRLNGIVIRRYLLKASKDENLAMEAYVQKYIMDKELAPTEEDVREFAKNNGISESDLDESMIERLKDIVKQNDRDNKISSYVAKNLIREPVQVSFPQSKLMVNAPELNETTPQWGSGPDQVLYLGHWDCEKCSTPLQSYLDVQSKGVAGIKGGFIYSFPPEDRLSRMGAEAGLCVNSIKPGSHAMFVRTALTSSEADTEKRINEAVEAVGIDLATFRDCFLKRQFQDQVDEHLKFASDLGVTQAPMLIIDGEVIEAPFRQEQLTAKLNSLGSKSSSGLWQRIKSLFGF